MTRQELEDRYVELRTRATMLVAETSTSYEEEIRKLVRHELSDLYGRPWVDDAELRGWIALLEKSVGMNAGGGPQGGDA